MRRLTVTDDATGAYVLLRGPVRDLLRDHGIPAMRSNVDRGWHLRRERLPDVLAMAQEAGYSVRVGQGAP